MKREVLIPHSYLTTKRLKNSRILGGAYASDTSAIIRSRKIKYLYIYKENGIHLLVRKAIAGGLGSCDGEMPEDSRKGLGAVMVRCQRIQEST